MSRPIGTDNTRHFVKQINMSSYIQNTDCSDSVRFEIRHLGGDTIY